LASRYAGDAILPEAGERGSEINRLQSTQGINGEGQIAGYGRHPTPHSYSAFITPGNQDEQHRMERLTLLAHEAGHLRRVPSSGSDWFDVVALDRVFPDSQTRLAARFQGGSVSRPRRTG
jgi:hypothetical protein